MKSTLKLALTALAFTSTSIHALNPVQGWYAGLMLGVSAQPNTNFTFVTPLGIRIPSGTGKITHSVLGDVGGQIGYRCNQFRIEGQLLYNNNPYDQLTINNLVINSPSSSSGLRLQGDTNTGAFMINGFYDIYTPNNDGSSKIVPYVGLGAGYSYVQNSLQFYFNDTLLSDNFKKTQSGAAAQAILGTSYFLDDFTTFSLDLRYFTNTATTKKTELNTFTARTQLYSINLIFNGAFDFG